MAAFFLSASLNGHPPRITLTHPAQQVLSRTPSLPRSRVQGVGIATKQHCVCTAVVSLRAPNTAARPLHTVARLNLLSDSPCCVSWSQLLIEQSSSAQDSLFGNFFKEGKAHKVRIDFVLRLSARVCNLPVYLEYVRSCVVFARFSAAHIPRFATRNQRTRQWIAYLRVRWCRADKFLLWEVTSVLGYLWSPTTFRPSSCDSRACCALQSTQHIGRTAGYL